MCAGKATAHGSNPIVRGEDKLPHASCTWPPCCKRVRYTAQHLGNEVTLLPKSTVRNQLNRSLAGFLLSNCIGCSDRLHMHCGIPNFDSSTTSTTQILRRFVAHANMASCLSSRWWSCQKLAGMPNWTHNICKCSQCTSNVRAQHLKNR